MTGSGLWRTYGPLILQLSHMNGGNLNQKVKDHLHACMPLQVHALMDFSYFVAGGMQIACPYQVHMVLQNIEMGAGSGQLPPVSLHHPDTNMQLFL